MPLRISIADDHEVVRRGVRALLENQPGWAVIGEASDGLAAVTQVLSLRPDIAIIDISMPRLNGLEAAKRILQSWPAARILIQTYHTSEQVVRESMEAGVRGIIFKAEAGGELLDAIRALSAGRLYLSAAAEPAVKAALRGDGPAETAGRLTTREREVVQAIAEGLSNKEIAARMEVSIRTVEAHRASAMEKVGAASTGALVRWAVRNRLVEP